MPGWLSGKIELHAVLTDIVMVTAHKLARKDTVPECHGLRVSKGRPAEEHSLSF